MVDWIDFARLLARYAKRDRVVPEDVLFGEGLELSSIAFTEFIMDCEETYGIDVDTDSLDAGIVTAGQLYARIAGPD